MISSFLKQCSILLKVLPIYIPIIHLPRRLLQVHEKIRRQVLESATTTSFAAAVVAVTAWPGSSSTPKRAVQSVKAGNDNMLQSINDVTIIRGKY